MAERLVAYATANDADGLEMVLRNFVEDIDEKDEKGNTALTTACHKGNIEAAQVLLKYEASTTKCNKRGMSPLALACIKVIIHPHKKTCALLPLCPLQTHLNVVRLLLENDAPVDMGALQCAVDAEDDEVMNLLAGLLEVYTLNDILGSHLVPKSDLPRIFRPMIV